MKQKWVKRIARGMLPCFVFFVFSFSFAPKAHAAEVAMNVTYGFQLLYTSDNNLVNRTSTGISPITSLSSPSYNGFGAYPCYADLYIWSDGNTTFSGPVKLYASYAFYGSGSIGSNFLDPSSFTIGYTNSFNQTGYVTKLDSIETVPNSSAVGGVTVAIEASWSGSEGKPIRGLRVYRTNVRNGYLIPANTTANCYMQYPSIRFISSEYSAELEALDKVADEIAEQNDLLLAMKGDIVAILQDIYQVTGDIETAATYISSYISAINSHLYTIKYNTADINTNLGSIYSFMGAMLSALETAISLNADNIEAAIEAQTAAMIAYFEQYFNTGNEVPDDTYQQQQDASNILDQMESLEKPNVDTIVPEIGDYTDSGVSGVLSAIFSSNLIVTMMTLSASFAFGAYVLFGKRE